MTEEELYKLYDELNALCFKGKLPRVKIKKHYTEHPYGLTKCKETKRGLNIQYISISNTFSEISLRQLMLHEMAHVQTIVKKRDYLLHHGIYFWYLALKFKIKYGIDIRVSSF